MSRVILVLLTISVVTLQTTTCQTLFVFDFMANVKKFKDFLEIGLNLIKSIHPPKAIENKNNTNELLRQLSRNIIGVENYLKGNFSAIIGKIDQLPDAIWAQDIKEKFEEEIYHIGRSFKKFAKIQIKNNKNVSWIGDSEKDDVSSDKASLEKNWGKFQHYLFNGKILDYLEKEESHDVCKTGISHFQLLERSLNQYMTVANQYFLSQHIIYNIREHIDKKDKSDDREDFNIDFESELESDVDKIKTAMSNSSTEYWLCSPIEPINAANFMPTMKKEYEQGSSNCEALQDNGYQCIPSNNNRKCDCIKSTMVINTALAQADPGYVIVGAQMKIDGNVLSMAANQAKLLPNGEIDKKTIEPVRNEKSGSLEDFIIRNSEMDFGKVEIPQGRYMTAVGFQKSTRSDSFYINAESMKYDFERKQFITGDVQKEAFKRNIWQSTKFARDIVKNCSNGKENVSWDDRISPLIDSRLVQSSDPEPLSGISIFHRKDNDKRSYIAIKINTYNSLPLIPKIPSLNELPIQEMLKSLSSSTALNALESKVENP